MADHVETDPRQTMQLAGVIGTVAVLLNILFYFLSQAYFDDRAATYGYATADEIMAVRVSFAMFTLGVAAFAIAAVRLPRLIGHGLAIAAGLAAVVGGVAAIFDDLHPVLPVSLFTLGVLLPVLVWRSLAGSRAAWSFLVSVCATLATIMLFGVTKIRGSLDIGLWSAMTLPGLLAVAAIGLVMIRDDYRDAERV